MKIKKSSSANGDPSLQATCSSCPHVPVPPLPVPLQKLGGKTTVGFWVMIFLNVKCKKFTPKNSLNNLG